MKNIVTTALLTLGLVATGGIFTASSQSLSSLNSACRTGDFEACSQYNSAIFAQRGTQGQVLSQGYDPFAIEPATHVTRTPTRPTENPADIAVGKSASGQGETTKSQ